MNLQIIFEQMKIEAKYYGEQDFDALGKIETEHSGKVCAFVSDRRFLKEMSDSISLVLTTEELAKEITGKSICVVENPRLTFFLLHNYLSSVSDYVRPRQDTIIGNACSISKHALIADYNVVIGNNVIIEEFVSIKENTVIGNDVVIRAGTIVGGEGFEEKRSANKVISVKHLGGVIIMDHAEIQYNTCIDKAIYPWDNTVIGEYCRIDNLVHIAHAAKLGKRVFVVALSLVAGAVTVGDDAWIGAGSTISNSLSIGNDARVNIGAVVTKNVAPNESVTGNFAIEHSKFIDFIKSIR